MLTVLDVIEKKPLGHMKEYSYTGQLYSRTAESFTDD